MTETDYYEGNPTIPAFIEFTEKFPSHPDKKMVKIKADQILTPCGYFKGLGKSDDVVGYRGVPGVESHGFQGPIHPKKYPYPIHLFALRFILVTDKIIDGDISDLVSQLDISTPSKEAVIYSKYQPLRFKEVLISQKVEITVGLYKNSLFNDYAKLIRTFKPDYTDLQVARRHFHDDPFYGPEYNPDFTTIKEKSSEDGLITSWVKEGFKKVPSGQYEYTFEIFYVDLIKPTNSHLLEKITKILISSAV